MNFWENIKIARYSIKTNLMRSILTVLGIIIGVSSVIMIITVGDGAREYIIDMINDLGSNTVSITVNTASVSASEYISKDDIAAIKSLESVEYISPIVVGVGNAEANGKTGVVFAMSGTPDLQYVMATKIKYGRFFTQDEYESAREVGVIPTMSALLLFGYEDCVGKYIEFSMNGRTSKIKIIGVSDAEGSTMDTDAMMEMSQNFMNGNEQTMSALLLPSTLTDIMMDSEGYYEMVYLTAVSNDLLDTAGNAAVNTLYARHGNYGKKAYSVTNMAMYINLLDTVIRLMTTFIAGVSGISLVVGGVGVMNIMLVSVTERTREIGIRKSLGAKTSVILYQFLTESIILCMIGGVMGLLFGVFGATAISAYLDIPIKLHFSTVALAIGFSSAIGIFFGIYPARKAALMLPIEALRRD
ncbi:MAG: ABC transporter permease [Clostridiales bacterium]|nr:ABC transporter permease [Clostridiales bacterium]